MARIEPGKFSGPKEISGNDLPAFITISVMAYLVLEIALIVSVGRALFVVAKRRHEVDWARRPAAPAKIESLNVHPGEQAKQPYVGRITYTFLVDGRTHSGWCARSFVTEQQAWEFMGQCLSRRLIARYKPEDPSESLLFCCPRAA